MNKLALAMLCGGMCAAQAQMADPTRPARGLPMPAPGAMAPAASPTPTASMLVDRFGVKAPTESSGLGALPPSSSSSPPVPRRATGPRLTSVMVGAGDRNAAVIDGQVYQPGEKVGGATLVSIDRLGVNLRGAAGYTRLWLLTRVDVPASAPVAAADVEPAASAVGKETP